MCQVFINANTQERKDFLWNQPDADEKSPEVVGLKGIVLCRQG